MKKDELGICPHCESSRGPIGVRCTETLCDKKGYHYIDYHHYRLAKSYFKHKKMNFDPLLGKRIDKYVLSGIIGHGGMGFVYVGYQLPLLYEVAVKVISQFEMNDITFRSFEREARAISILSHPNIVKLYDFGLEKKEPHVPYMILEYIKNGKNLRVIFRELLKHKQKLDLEIVAHIFKQIFNAISSAHKHGIIHRDIKPENIMIKKVTGDPYFVKILDFGLAKAMENIKGFEQSIYKTGTFIGTPTYMAPEQLAFDHKKKLDHRIDIYSTGVVLLEALGGKKPFQGSTIKEVVSKKMNPNYNPIVAEKLHHIPEPLQKFILKAIAKDPDDRFQSVDEMKEAFFEALKQVNINIPKIYVIDILKQIDERRILEAKKRLEIQRLKDEKTVIVSNSDESTVLAKTDDQLAPSLEIELIENLQQDPSRGRRYVFMTIFAIFAVIIGAIGGIFLKERFGNSKNIDKKVQKQVVSTAKIKKNKDNPGLFIKKDNKIPKTVIKDKDASKKDKYIEIYSKEIMSFSTTLTDLAENSVGAFQKLNQDILITSVPARALVVVDGKKVGFTPLKLNFLSLKDAKTITLKKKGFFRKKISINKNELLKNKKLKIRLIKLKKQPAIEYVQ